MSEIGAMKKALEGPPAAGVKPVGYGGAGGYTPTAQQLGGGSATGDAPQGILGNGIMGTRNRPMLLSEIMARG